MCASLSWLRGIKLIFLNVIKDATISWLMRVSSRGLVMFPSLSLLRWINFIPLNELKYGNISDPDEKLSLVMWCLHLNNLDNAQISWLMRFSPMALVMFLSLSLLRWIKLINLNNLKNDYISWLMSQEMFSFWDYWEDSSWFILIISHPEDRFSQLKKKKWK